MIAWIPVVAAFVAAITVSVGYFVTSRSKLVDGRREAYANALLAVESYKQLPYRIRRRTDSENSTRSALGALISDSERDLNYYMALLDLDSDSVARRFRALALNARYKGTEFRAKAWKEQPITVDASMRFEERYGYEDRLKLDTCKLAMRRQLKLLRLR